MSCAHHQAFTARPCPPPHGYGLPAPKALSGLHEVLGDAYLPLTAALLLAGSVVAVRPGRSLVLLNDPRRGLRPCREGLAQLGIDPSRVLWIHEPDPRRRLKLMDECARSPALAAVVAEWQSHVKGWDLVATRRLVLAAERSGAFLVAALAGQAVTGSAAHVRWRVEPAPSQRLEGDAPGEAMLRLAIERRRGAAPTGPIEMRWNHEACCFDEVPAGPPVSGAAVPAAVHREAGQGSNIARSA